MSEKIYLKQLKETLDYNRSVSNQPSLLKYIAMFLDQSPVALQTTANIMESLEKAKAKGVAINQAVIVQAVRFELTKLLGDTKFWGSLNATSQIIFTQQVLGMSQLNRVLQQALVSQVDVTKHLKPEEYEELTGITKLTKGQLWNLKMRKAKEAKKKRLEQEQQHQIVEEPKPGVEQPKEQPKPVLDDVYEDAFSQLTQFMTEGEIKELRELNDLKF